MFTTYENADRKTDDRYKSEIHKHLVRNYDLPRRSCSSVYHLYKRINKIHQSLIASTRS